MRAQRILERGERCEDCGHAPTPRNPLHLDHVNGDKRDDWPGNHRLRCQSCHSRKTVLQDMGRRGGRWAAR